MLRYKRINNAQILISPSLYKKITELELRPQMLTAYLVLDFKQEKG